MTICRSWTRWPALALFPTLLAGSVRAQEPAQPGTESNSASNLSREIQPGATLPSADEFCPKLLQAMSAAADDFKAIRGKGNKETGWDTVFKLPGFSRCHIESDGADPTYTCEIEAAETYKGARKDLDNTKSLVAGCLGDSWKEAKELKVPTYGIQAMFMKHGSPYVHVDLYVPRSKGNPWKIKILFSK